MRRQQHRQALRQQQATDGRRRMRVRDQQDERNGGDLVARRGDGSGGAESNKRSVAQQTAPRANGRRRFEVGFFCSSFDFRSALG
jgi:hypothetical protein